MLRRLGLASFVIGLLLAAAGCGGGDEGKDDPIRFTSADVQAHFKQETGIKLAVTSRAKIVDTLGPPDQAAIDRYGSFTVNVAKTEGAIKALQSAHLGTEKRFDNVVVDWISIRGEDRAPYERSLGVFQSLGD